MKTLYIARHAKSNWGQAGYTDFERPLNEQGIIDAKLMARHLSSLEIKVDSVITSSAVRALTTANMYAKQILSQGAPVGIDVIYEAEERIVLEVIRDISNDFDVVMLVGHNPGISLLISMLTGHQVDMSAGDIAELKIDLKNWNDIGMSSAQLVQMFSPKNISL